MDGVHIYQPRYISTKTDFGYAPLGGLGKRTVEKGTGAKLRSRPIGPPQTLKRLFDRILDVLTPKWVRAEGKYRRALEDYSAQMGKILGGLFNRGARGTDRKSVMKGLAALRNAARPMTKRGAKYDKLLQIRVRVHLKKLTREETTALAENLNNPESYMLKAELKDASGSKDMLADLRSVETIIKEEAARLSQPERTPSKSVNVAQEVVKAVKKTAVTIKNTLETFKKSLLSQFKPLLDKVKTTDVKLRGLTADAEKVIQETFEELKRIDPTKKDCNSDDFLKLFNKMEERVGKSIGKAIRVVTEDLHPQVQQAHGHKDFSKYRVYIQDAQQKIRKLSAMFGDLHESVATVKEASLFKQLVSDLEIISNKATDIDTEDLKAMIPRLKRFGEKRLYPDKPREKDGVKDLDSWDTSALHRIIAGSKQIQNKERMLSLIETYGRAIKAQEQKADGMPAFIQRTRSTIKNMEILKSMVDTADQAKTGFAALSKLHIMDQDRCYGKFLSCLKDVLELGSDTKPSSSRYRALERKVASLRSLMRSELADLYNRRNEKGSDKKTIDSAMEKLTKIYDRIETLYDHHVELSKRLGRGGVTIKEPQDEKAYHKAAMELVASLSSAVAANPRSSTLGDLQPLLRVALLSERPEEIEILKAFQKKRTKLARKYPEINEKLTAFVQQLEKKDTKIRTEQLAEIERAINKPGQIKIRVYDYHLEFSGAIRLTIDRDPKFKKLFGIKTKATKTLQLLPPRSLAPKEALDEDGRVLSKEKNRIIKHDFGTNRFPGTLYLGNYAEIFEGLSETIDT